MFETRQQLNKLSRAPAFDLISGEELVFCSDAFFYTENNFIRNTNKLLERTLLGDTFNTLGTEHG